LLAATRGPSTISNTYNNRLQPATISAANPGGTPILNLSYDFHLGVGNNGNVFKITNGRDGNRTQNFTYDNLNRITTAYTTGSNWGETFTIDAWGNLTNKAGYAGKTLYESLKAAPATIKNQLPGYTYDPAGNMTNDGRHTYTYAAENRLITVDGGVWNYTYDGDGHRVKKCSNPCTSATSGTVYWDNIVDGSILQESDLGGTFKTEYATLNGTVIGRTDLPANTPHYYFYDHLGSTSLVTDVNGTMSACPTNTSLITGEDESDYYPYGGEMQLCNRVPQNYKFTGKERDTESGLDDFEARYYSSILGRFMTPDWDASPEPVPYADFSDPQSINQYVYVRNNPLLRVDLDGHDGYDTRMILIGTGELVVGFTSAVVGAATSEVGVGVPVALLGAATMAKGAVDLGKGLHPKLDTKDAKAAITVATGNGGLPDPLGIIVAAQTGDVQKAAKAVDTVNSPWCM